MSAIILLMPPFSLSGGGMDPKDFVKAMLIALAFAIAAVCFLVWVTA